MDARRIARTVRWAGDPGPWRQQAIPGRARWSADALRDVARDHALETLADADAVLVIDETGFLKQGKSSCGVGRQHTGSAGKITNCQAGVFAAYVSRHGHAFVDRALYRPKAWTDTPSRRAAAHVPDTVGFATKPRLAVGMIERAIAAGVAFSWVAAASVYGVGVEPRGSPDEVERALRRANKGYVLGVGAGHGVNSWIGKPEVAGTAKEIAEGLPACALPACALPACAWQRLSAGQGTKGERLHDWAYLDLADLGADEHSAERVGLWTRGLLVRRRIADGELACATTWCPAGTAIDALVGIEGHRWAIEDSFETAKTGFGLDHNETRSWHGWHRHVSLVMLAFAARASIRHRANQPTPPKTPRPLTRARRPSSAGPSRTSAASPPAWRSSVSSLPTSSHGRSGEEPTRP